MTQTEKARRHRRWPAALGASAVTAALCLTLTPASAAIDDLFTSPDGSTWTLSVDNEGDVGANRRSGPTPTTPPPTTTPPTTTPPVSTTPTLTFAGAWEKAGTDTFTNAVGASATIRFTGTGLTVTGWRASHHKNATVTVDGKAAGSTTSVATTRGEGTIFTVGGLTSGEHTVVLTSTGTISVTGAKLGGTSPTTPPVTTAPPTTTPPTTTPPVVQPTGLAPLTVKGNEIQAAGANTWFVGYNSFTLNGGCGTAAEISAARTQGKAFIDSMRKDGHGILRLWYFNQYPASVKAYTQELVNYAAERNIYTILTLSDGQKHCGNAGPTTLTETHVKEAANRFKDNPGVGWFEVANEPVSSDWDAGFLNRARDTGTWIKAVDSDRLVGTGTQASYFIGSDERQRQLNALSVIDIASLHGYETGCGESRVDNEIRLAAGKPVGMGEFGIDTNGSGTARASTFQCKLDTWAPKAGFAYAIAWAYQPGSAATGYGTLDRDPAAQRVLREAKLD